MIIKRRRHERKKGWFEIFLDDTTFIEKIVYIIWLFVPYAFYLMFDIFDMWIRVLLSGGIFIIISFLIYGFAMVMSNEDRYWNR